MLAYPANLWLINRYHATNGYGAKMSPRNQSVALTESQLHVIDPTNPGRALDDSIKHRLYIRRRPADNAKHLGGCGLMLEGFAQFCIALLKLLEQPHVFNRDHRLVSKGGYEIELLIGKTIDSVPPKDKHSDHNTVSQQRHPQQAAVTFDTLLFLQSIVRVSENILDLNRATLQRHPASYGPAIRRQRVSMHELLQLSNGGVGNCQVVLTVL